MHIRMYLYTQYDTQRYIHTYVHILKYTHTEIYSMHICRRVEQIIVHVRTYTRTYVHTHTQNMNSSIIIHYRLTISVSCPRMTPCGIGRTLTAAIVTRFTPWTSTFTAYTHVCTYVHTHHVEYVCIRYTYVCAYS